MNTRTRRAKDYWEKVIGTNPTLVAYERPDRDGIVHVRYWDRDEKKYKKPSLHLRIRNARRRVDPRLRRQAEKRALTMWRELAAWGCIRSNGHQLDAAEETNASIGELIHEGQEAEDEVYEETRAASAPEPGRFSIGQAFDLAYGRTRKGLSLERRKALRGSPIDSRNPICPVYTTHAIECRSAADVLVELYGYDMPIEALGTSAIPEIWRRLAQQYRERKAYNARVPKEKRVPTGGVRRAQFIIGVLLQTSRWLAEIEQMHDLHVIVPPKRWRERLRRDWPTLSGERLSEPEDSDRRHTVEEAGRLLRTAAEGNCDVRLALALRLGAEARLGQVVRVTRNDVRLADPAYPFGLVVVRDAGKKKGVRIALTEDQRAALDAALSGYLADLEQAYISGDRADYPLSPQGRLRRGRARADRSAAPLHKGALNDLFRELEENAGVESKRGRVWYGLRRVLADLAEDAESDERVLNALTGHTSSATRQRLYQAKRNLAVDLRASKTREAMRTLTVDAASSSPSPDGVAAEDSVKPDGDVPQTYPSATVDPQGMPQPT